MTITNAIRTTVKSVKVGSVVLAEPSSSDRFAPTGMSHSGAYMVRIDSISRCSRKGADVRVLGTVIGVDSNYPEDVELAESMGAIVFDILAPYSPITAI